MPQVRGRHDAGVTVIVSYVAGEKGGTCQTLIATNLVRLLDGHAHLIPDTHILPCWGFIEHIAYIQEFMILKNCVSLKKWWCLIHRFRRLHGLL